MDAKMLLMTRASTVGRLAGVTASARKPSGSSASRSMMLRSVLENTTGRSVVHTSSRMLPECESGEVMWQRTLRGVLVGAAWMPMRRHIAQKV